MSNKFHVFSYEQNICHSYLDQFVLIYGHFDCPWIYGELTDLFFSKYIKIKIKTVDQKLPEKCMDWKFVIKQPYMKVVKKIREILIMTKFRILVILQ